MLGNYNIYSLVDYLHAQNVFRQCETCKMPSVEDSYRSRHLSLVARFVWLSIGPRRGKYRTPAVSRHVKRMIYEGYDGERLPRPLMYKARLRSHYVTCRPKWLNASRACTLPSKGNRQLANLSANLAFDINASRKNCIFFFSIFYTDKKIMSPQDIVFIELRCNFNRINLSLYLSLGVISMQLVYRYIVANDHFVKL